MAGPALGHASAKMRPARSRSVKTAACTAALGRATVPSCRGTSRKQCQYGSEDYHFLLYQSLKPRQGQELYKSLTWDRGKEMSAHKRFTLATDIQVYFCDPRSPWQRGSNENTNGLLRQYMPKGIDISNYSQAKLNAMARQLNERPRKTLGFQTPAEMFSQSVALTG